METKQNLTKSARSSLLVVSLATVLTAMSPANAASACKGLDNSACESQSACRWVESYERKDGRKVKGFCRAKPVPKKALAAWLKFDTPLTSVAQN